MDTNVKVIWLKKGVDTMSIKANWPALSHFGNSKDPNACECSGRKVRKSHLNAKPTIPKALVNIPANDARVARRCMMLLHLFER
jgi:hypothetical protein